MPNTLKKMKVTIEELSFKTIIGILKFERKKPQKVVVKIEFEYLFDKENKAFIDYSEVVTHLKNIMKKEKFGLIEEAIVYLHDELHKLYDISNLSIKITKPTILKNCLVSVENS